MLRILVLLERKSPPQPQVFCSLQQVIFQDCLVFNSNHLSINLNSLPFPAKEKHAHSMHWTLYRCIRVKGAICMLHFEFCFLKAFLKTSGYDVTICEKGLEGYECFCEVFEM
ncbi:hypothetical protein XENOCAPTIV_008111 [Xenoophorus captivus]|uniref:Uncharacterized protein n=1 Tax=Xenoophorus captivus TaxID=1517983 RepID=A0ABV0RVB5_9TELE